MNGVKGAAISLLIVAIGFAWLLNNLHVIRGVDWLWTGLLGTAGILMLVICKVNKLTFVVGLFLIVGSVFSVLRQTGSLSVDIEVPVLVMVLGALMLISQWNRIPSQPWFVAEEPPK